MLTSATIRAGIESPFAWLRLVAAVVLGTIGSVGIWSVPVVLPAVQGEVGIARRGASLALSLAGLWFSLGGGGVGRPTGRFGVRAPALFAAGGAGLGSIADR